MFNSETKYNINTIVAIHEHMKTKGETRCPEKVRVPLENSLFRKTN